MKGPAHRLLFLLAVIVLVAAETLYFGRQAVAGYQRLLGRHAFINSDFSGAWEAYTIALESGGERSLLEPELLDLTVFALLQEEAGISLDLPLPPDDRLPLALSLVQNQLNRAPYEARAWSKVADIQFYEARQIRRATPFDVSDLSEEPRKNLLPAEESALESLRTAASLEPNHYLYHDLLAEFLIQIGALDLAAPAIRKAVVAYPRLDAHVYLSGRETPQEIADAALEGFREAASSDSMIRRAIIWIDAGYLNMRRGLLDEAIDFFEKAVAEAPGLFDSQYRLGQALYRNGDYLRAVEHLRLASEILPLEASAYSFLGLANEALGDLSASIEALTLARQKRPGSLGIRHDLGRVLEAAGRPHEAERQYVAATSLSPDNPVAWIELARYYVRMSDYPAALESCSRLAALDTSRVEFQDYCAALRRESR